MASEAEACCWSDTWIYGLLFDRIYSDDYYYP